MPLSEPQPREMIHDRTVRCHGYLRDDGLWDIEGRIVDTKSYGFDMFSRGYINPGDSIHDMWIRVTITEDMEIVDVEASMEARPYDSCPEILLNFKRLIGVRIARGFNRKVKELVGGTEGCTHIAELLGPLATTAYQAVGSMQYRRRRIAGEPQPRTKPWNLNSCHSWNSNGEVIRQQYPEYYTGSQPVPEVHPESRSEINPSE